MCTLGMSSQIVSAFHLSGSLSIQLFICTSAGYVRAPVVCFSVCLCASLAKVGRQAASCNRGFRGSFQTQSQQGIVCEIQMLEMPPLFAYCYHCSFGAEENRLRF